MKKSFKAILIVAMVAVSAGVSAQLSVNAGYANSATTVKAGSTSNTADGVNGVTAGVGYDMNVQGGFGLFWGLNYTYAWNKEEGTFWGITGTSNSVDHYLDVPVRLTFGLPITDAFKVFAFGGPKFVYALAGKTTYSLSSGESSASSEPSDHYKDTDLSRFDIKLGLGAGVQFSNIIVKGGYDWGMLNQYTGDIDDYSSKINQFYVTLGVTF